MNVDNLDTELSKLVDNYTEQVKTLLESTNADSETHQLMYNVGAEVKHALDGFRTEIVKYLKENQ